MLAAALEGHGGHWFMDARTRRFPGTRVLHCPEVSGKELERNRRYQCFRFPCKILRIRREDLKKTLEFSGFSLARDVLSK
jgi:hypothetical protein